MSNWEGKVDINRVFVLQPTRPTTYFGVGAIAKVSEIVEGMAKKGQGKILVVTDKIAYRASGAWDIVEPALQQYATMWKHYDNVRPNPTYDNCEEAAAMGTAMNADCILAIGGGSSMDTAKTAAVLMKHPERSPSISMKKGKPSPARSPSSPSTPPMAPVPNAMPLPWRNPTVRTNRRSIRLTSTPPSPLRTRG